MDEYGIWIETNEKGCVATIFKKSEFSGEFVTEGFGPYELNKGIEIIKQNGNVVDNLLLPNNEMDKIAELLLKVGLPKNQISSLML